MTVLARYAPFIIPAVWTIGGALVCFGVKSCFSPTAPATMLAAIWLTSLLLECLCI